ncbi:MAG TPA: helix-turn-helix domain-containing protein [Pseudonocardia sp.]|jgi:DNA-binding PucR family transcriptional regulator
MPSDVRTIVADVAQRIQADLPSLTEELTDHFVQIIPEFRHDEAVRQLMVASTSSNLATVFDILAHGIAVDRITVPAAAAEYARRFAQRGLSLEGLLRAYRLGEHRVVRWTLRYLGTLDLDVADVIATSDLVAVIVNRYIDQVIEGLIDIYELERQRWDRRSDTARAAQLQTVLSTDTLDLASAEEMLGVSLRGWHLAAVVWVDSTVPDAERYLRTATRLLGEASRREPMTMLADDHTLWAWLSSAGRLTVNLELLKTKLADTPAVHLALGELDSGLAGFRSSHRAALRARAVSEAARGPAPSVIEFQSVAIAALMSDNLDDLRRWVTRTLGELARDDEAMARLRETVRVFLQCGGSYTDAAARLHMHKNTVNYRARKAEELIGHPLSENRLDVEVALLVADLLGTRVIEAT